MLSRRRTGHVSDLRHSDNVREQSNGRITRSALRGLRFLNEKGWTMTEIEQRQAVVLREFKARYHEMAAQIAFLQGKLEACRPVLEELSRYDVGEQASLASNAQKLLDNWPSDTL